MREKLPPIELSLASQALAHYDLVVPGNPDKSWLFLKLSGAAATAACSGDCNRQRMPAGMTLTEDEIVVIRQWILQGAPGPQ